MGKVRNSLRAKCLRYL